MSGLEQRIAEMARTAMDAKDVKGAFGEGAKEGEIAAQAGVAAPIRALGTVASGLSAAVFAGPLLGTALGWVGERGIIARRSPKLAEGLTRVKEITHLAHVPAAEISGKAREVLGAGRITGAIETLEGAAGAVAHNVSAIGSRLADNAVVSSVANSRVGAYAKKRLFPSGLGARMGQNSVGNLLIIGTMTVGDGIKSFEKSKARIHALQDMQSELTGIRPSAFQADHGNKLHPMVLEARLEKKGIRAKLAAGVKLAGSVAQTAMMLLGGAGLGSVAKAIGVNMAADMASNALASSDTVLDSYAEMKASFGHSGGASLEMYKGVIGGFLKNQKYETIEKIAVQWCKEKIPPAEVLRRIDLIRTKGLMPAIASAADANAPVQAANDHTLTDKLRLRTGGSGQRKEGFVQAEAARRAANVDSARQRGA